MQTIIFNLFLTDKLPCIPEREREKFLKIFSVWQLTLFLLPQNDFYILLD